MVRRSLIGLLLLWTAVLIAVAQDAPVMVQPGQAGYSPAQLTSLGEALTRLQGILNNINLGSKKQFGVGGWTYERFAAYTAGTLERLGYTVSIVSRQLDAGAIKTWVAVRVDLTGAIAWIPVEPLSNVATYQNDLGNIPLVSPLLYDSSYLTYDTVVQLSSNIPPTAAIRTLLTDVVEGEPSSWFGNTSVDPDGEIVLYQWTFGEVVQQIVHNISTWYTFASGGQTYPVYLTVTDNRGAQATAMTTVYVLTQAEKEAKNCGCHDS